MQPLDIDDLVAIVTGPKGDTGPINQSDIDALKGGVVTAGNTLAKLYALILARATLDGAALTNATTTTQAEGNNSTKLATTAFTRQELVNYAQPYDALLAAIAGLVTSADQFAYFTGSDAVAQTPLTAFARSLLDDPDAATMRATLAVLALAGGTLTGPLTLAADPSSALQAATKQYVDSVAQGLDAKQSVRFRTTTNINLASGLAVGTTHDGVTAVAGDRALVPAQTAGAQNGIYIVPASGAAARATDMDAWTEVPGAFVFIEEGTFYADTGWVCTANVGGTLGTTAIGWTQFSGAGTYTAGAMLGLTGTQFAVTDPELLALGGLTSAANTVPMFSGAGSATLLNAGAFGQTLLAAATAAVAKTALAIAAADIGDASANGRSLITAADYAAMRTLLGLVIDTNVQAYSANLAAFSSKTAPAGAVVGTTDAQTLTTKTIDASGNTISNLSLSMFATNVIDTDGTLAANSDTRVATQKAVVTYVAGRIAALDVMVLKGGIDCSASPNYPAADAGATYRVTVSGKIGGPSGPNVEAGDMLFCFVDATAAGTQAAVGANWDIVQMNLDGAVIGPASATSGNAASFSGTSGKLIQDSGKALPSGGIVGTTDAQTLTNKTLTDPIVGTQAANDNSTKAASTAYVDAGDAGRVPQIAVAAKSSAYTAVAADNAGLLICSGTWTLAFTAAATLGSKWRCLVRNAGTGVITLDPNSAETIDGVTTIDVQPGEAFEVRCDGAAFYSVGRIDTSAWTAWTPTVSSSVGTISTLGTVTARYKRLGAKFIAFHIEINITTNGTGSSYLQFTLPFNTASTGRQTVVGQELLTSGKFCGGFINASSNVVGLRAYDNTYPGADGAQVAINGVVEIA